MQISLPPEHRCVRDLNRLMATLRSCHSGKSNDASCDFLQRALAIDETHHGSGTVTFSFDFGHAAPDEAVLAYDYLRRKHPDVLDLYYMAVTDNHARFEVEIGSLNRIDEIVYSAHDMVRLLPKILVNFRGGLPQNKSG